MKLLLRIIAAISGFAVGAIASVLVARLFIGAPDPCPAPCDGPAYVMLGVVVLLAPIMGTLCAGLALWAVLHVQRH